MTITIDLWYLLPIIVFGISVLIGLRVFEMWEDNFKDFSITTLLGTAIIVFGLIIAITMVKGHLL